MIKEGDSFKEQHSKHDINARIAFCLKSKMLLLLYKRTYNRKVTAMASENALNQTKLFTNMLNRLNISVERIELTTDKQNIAYPSYQGVAYVLFDERKQKFITNRDERIRLYYTPDAIVSRLEQLIDENFTFKLLISLANAGLANEIFNRMQNRTITYDTIAALGDYFRRGRSGARSDQEKRRKFYENHADEFALFQMLATNCSYVDLDSLNSSELSENITVLDIPSRAVNVLARWKITTIRQLVNTTEEQLLQMRNMGAGTVDEIKAALSKINLHLRKN